MKKCPLIGLLVLIVLAGCTKIEEQTPGPVARRLSDLNHCIDFLESVGGIVRVRSAVSAKYELAAVARKFEGRQCVLFERVHGSRHPVFMGLLWSRDNVARLFGIPEESVPFVLADAIGRWHADKNALPGNIFEKGPANEVVEDDINLYKLDSASGARFTNCAVRTSIFSGIANPELVNRTSFVEINRPVRLYQV